MPFLILLIGQWLIKALPNLLGFAARAPLLIAAVTLAGTTFVAAGLLSDAALGGLHSAISARPDVWCLATAFGVDLGLYWFIQSTAVSVAILVFVTVKAPFMAAAAEFTKALT